MSAKSRSVTVDVYGDRVDRMGVGLSGLRQVGKIFLYGILFNLVLVGVPFCIDAVKADVPDGILTRSVDRHLQAEFAANPAEFSLTGTLAIYSLLLGWVVVCGMFVQEAKGIG